MFIMTPTVRPHPATLKSANPYQERHSVRVGQMSAVCVTFRPSGVPEWLLAPIATKRLAIDVGLDCDIKLAVEAAVWAE